MTKKLTATNPVTGEVLTRRTDRTYTHVVVSKRNEALDRELDSRYAAEDARRNFDYWVSMAEGREKYPQYTSDAEREEARRIKALGKDGFVADRVAKALAAIDDRVARGGYQTFFLAGWCGRHDLAQKLADKCRKAGDLEVTIIPVNQ